MTLTVYWVFQKFSAKEKRDEKKKIYGSVRFKNDDLNLLLEHTILVVLW